jgi:hypothetical protein
MAAANKSNAGRMQFKGSRSIEENEGQNSWMMLYAGALVRAGFAMVRSDGTVTQAGMGERCGPRDNSPRFGSPAVTPLH